jgi:abortive infection bacteriophage resistance protein
MHNNPPLPPKDYKSYEELLELLISRGMIVENRDRALRKIAQVGYYRLSGFSYSSRKVLVDDASHPILCDVLKRNMRNSHFIEGTSFNQVFSLYLFDKHLRVLMMDALERIEVYIRSIVAHEIGKGNKPLPGSGALVPDPMAWNSNTYINNKYLKPRGKRASVWDEWLENHKKLIDRSREDCIKWHKAKNKAMPFWVVIETWDFGTLSKYFGMLKATYQARVCKRLGLNRPKDGDVLSSWLMSMNILRNRCAHHSRIWNQRANSSLQLPDLDFFNRQQLDENSLHRLFGLIIAMHYLMKQIGPSSTWMNEVMAEIRKFPNLPGCHLSALGIPPQGAPDDKMLELNEVILVKASKQ